MVRIGYIQCQSDHILFVKRMGSQITVLIVYVDDIVVTGNDVVEIKYLKSQLVQEFKIKDLGQLKYFSGIEVVRSKKGIFISQRKYILDLFSETSVLGCKLITTLMDPNQKLHDSNGVRLIDANRYKRLVGRLIYLSLTCLDIAFAIPCL